MAKLVVLYRKAADPVAFRTHYLGTHVLIAKKMPGLVDYEVSDGPVGAPRGESPYELVATLTFASMDALKQGLGSPEGRAAAADVPNFAQAGVEMLVFDTQTV